MSSSLVRCSSSAYPSNENPRMAEIRRRKKGRSLAGDPFQRMETLHLQS